MYGLADISLFESVTNCKCTIFNDTYSDVVEDSDPLASRPKRIKELSKKNPVKKNKPEVIRDITQKIDEADASQGKKGIEEQLDLALGSLHKIETHIKKVSEAEDADDKGRVFLKKYGDKVKQVCDSASRTWSYLQKMDAPKNKMVIVIREGEMPEMNLSNFFDQQSFFGDPVGMSITEPLDDFFSFDR